MKIYLNTPSLYVDANHNFKLPKTLREVIEKVLFMSNFCGTVITNFLIQTMIHRSKYNIKYFEYTTCIVICRGGRGLGLFQPNI